MVAAQCCAARALVGMTQPELALAAKLGISTVADFERDTNLDRRRRNLQRIRQYAPLEQPAACPWNTDATSANEACDNEILYALECAAVHALVLPGNIALK